MESSSESLLSIDDRVVVSTSAEALLFNAEYHYAIGDFDKALEVASIVYLLSSGSKATVIEFMHRCNQRVNRPSVVKSEPKKEEPPSTDTISPLNVTTITKKEEPSSEDDLLAKQILDAQDLFDMVKCKPWDPITDIDKAFKRTIFSAHTDRNNSTFANKASSKLTEEIKKFRAHPSNYTKTIEQARADRGIRDPSIDPLFDRDGYGKIPLNLGANGEVLKETLDPLSGFDREGKRSYTWFAAAGPKRHVDCNPAAANEKDPEGKAASALYASKAGEHAWMGLLEFSDSTAHKFSNKGKYQTFSERGVSSSKHGTKFLAKNK